MIYSIDTSAILDAWVRWYPPDVFSSLWQNIERLIEDGSLRATEEVRVELEKKEDEVFRWAKGQDRLFLPLTQEVQIAAQEILTAFPRLVDSRKERSQADPFVIALAKVNNATVITGEKNVGTPQKPRIPLVCNHFGIRCINMVKFIREQGWIF